MDQKDDKNVKVLVIDPDKDFARDVRIFLEETYYVDTKQELDHLDYTFILNRIDVIILAVDSVGQNVIALLEQVRANHRKIKIIIMYTYFSSDREIEKTLVNYADDMITKLFDVALLKSKVDSLLIPVL